MIPGIPISSATLTHAAGRNEVIFSGNVSWTSNENAIKTLDVPVPDYGENFLISVKNGSAVVALTVDIGNLATFITSNEVVPLVSMGSVAASTNKSAVVTGFPMAGGGRITFTKSATTAAAFSAYVVVRRIS